MSELRGVEIHERYMRRAIELARENVRSGTGGPFAAVVTGEGGEVATGVNRVTVMNDPTAHAEILAIRAACASLGDFRLAGCTIYTTCEPCPMCLGAIYWARIGTIYYAASRRDAAVAGFDDDEIYEEVTVPHHERHIPIEQVLREDSLVVFREWGEDEGRVVY